MTDCLKVPRQTSNRFEIPADMSFLIFNFNTMHACMIYDLSLSTPGLHLFQDYETGKLETTALIAQKKLPIFHII